jgi:hypothetical protein
VARPRRANTSTTTPGVAPHAMQTHQLAACASNWPRQEP